MHGAFGHGALSIPTCGIHLRCNFGNFLGRLILTVGVGTSFFVIGIADHSILTGFKERQVSQPVDISIPVPLGAVAPVLGGVLGKDMLDSRRIGFGVAGMAARILLQAAEDVFGQAFVLATGANDERGHVLLKLTVIDILAAESGIPHGGLGRASRYRLCSLMVGWLRAFDVQATCHWSSEKKPPKSF